MARRCVVIALMEDATRSEIIATISRKDLHRPLVHEVQDVSLRVVDGPAVWAFPINDTCPWKITLHSVKRDDDTFWGSKWGEARVWKKGTRVLALAGDS